MICRVQGSGYCPRHRVVHQHRMLELSQLDSPLGELYRRKWDMQVEHGLGSAIAHVLSMVGITEVRVSKLLRRPCRCKRRIDWLNRLL
jgi:hypothetical protein